MAGKAKFDQEAAFKTIIGVDREQGEKVTEPSEKKSKKKDRVQRSYYLERDTDKALWRMAVEEEKTLTEVVNEILRAGVRGYL